MDNAEPISSAASSGGRRIHVPQIIPYTVVVCLMILAMAQAWRVSTLKKQLAWDEIKLQANMDKTLEDAERANLAELRLARLQVKDPAYTAASITVAWNRHIYEGVISIDNLPPPPAGHTYQLWVLDPKASTPISAGLISYSVPSRHFSVGRIGTSGPGFAVSLETEEGGNLPAGPILFAVAPEE